MMLTDNVSGKVGDITVNADPTIYDLPAISESFAAAGDAVLPYTMPQAEYMYGCVAASVGMLLGYYDLYGYTANGVKYNFSKLVPGTISIISRGSDGGSIYDMSDPSVLARFIASPEYVERFYDKTPAQEKPYAFVNGDPAKGVNTSIWNCLADYLGTGQYWRGCGDLSTSLYYTSLEFLTSPSCDWTTDITADFSIDAKWNDFKYGLSLYVQSVGYELDERHTYSVAAEEYSFEQFKAQIDAGRPVLVSLRNSDDGGHMVIAYGYNAATKEIIFDDTYRTDCRMKWNGSYYYSKKYYTIKGFSVVALKTDEAPPPVEVCRGRAPVSSGTNIYNKTLKTSGSETSIYVYRGGMVSATTVSSGGHLYVSNGGMASATTVNSSGFLYVYSGGVVSSATLKSSSYVYASGGIVRGAVVSSRGNLHVRSDGVAENASVSSGGFLCVSNGGVAQNAVVNSSGYLYVYSNGVASVATMQSGGRLYVSNGGAAISGAVKSTGYLILSNGAMGMSATLSGLGYMLISNRGIANGVTASSGGSLYVSSGGVANSVTILSSGGAVVYAGASVNGLSVNADGSMFVYSGARISDKVTLATGSYLYMYTGGVLDFDISRRTVNAGLLVNNLALVLGSPVFTVTVSAANQQFGTYALANGAAGFSKTVTVKNESGTAFGSLSVGGSLTRNGVTYSLVSSGGTLSFKVSGNSSPLVSGAVKIYNSANTVLVSAAGSMTGRNLRAVGEDRRLVVSSGGRASATTISSGGAMEISRGGVANFTLILNSGLLTVSNGGSASNTTVSSGTSGGRMTVQQGGTATRTTVSGAMYLSGGTGSATAVGRGGKVYVSGGGVANQTAVNSMGILYVCGNGKVSATTVNGYGYMYVRSAGSASGTLVNSCGSMYVSGGGVASRNSVGNYGYLFVYSGGSAVDNTVASNGTIYVSSGGKITGKISLESGAKLSAYAGGVVDFNLVGVAAGEAVRINNLSRVFGSPTYTLTVSNSQAFGEYLLAGGALGFDTTIKVKNSYGGDLGTLSVGGKLKSGGVYRLAAADGMLSLTLRAGAADLNCDGRAEVLMTITKTGHGAYGATGAWLIQNTQTAAWGDLSTRNAGWELFGTGVAEAGKKTNDVYIKSTGNVVGAWVTNDKGKVTAWKTVGQFDGNTQVLGLGDFNGDGQTDLLLRNKNGAVGCHLTDGTGWNYFQSLGSEWKIVGVGDLNGDGRDDVVLKHDAGFAGSWLTQADCTMAWANLDTLASGFGIVGCGDFDGDGTSDVLLKKGNYYGAWLVENGSVKSWMGLGDLGNVTVEEIADFDNDGRDDLRIRTAAGDLGSQLVKGTDNLQWKYYGSVGSEWSTSLAAL